MKKVLIGLVAGAALIFAASPAHAISVSADIPLQFNYTKDIEQKADSVSGAKVLVSLPILIGFGLETYTAEFDDGTGKFSSSYQFLDVFYELPIPVINISVGLGLGQSGATYEVPGAPPSDYDNGLATQYWLSLGYPLIPLIDLHLGYHVVDVKVGIPGGSGDVNVGGNMLSLGMRIGF